MPRIHVDVRQEIHLHGLESSAFAFFASSACDVEAEPAGFVAAYGCFRQFGKQGTDFVEDPGIGGGIAAGRAANGALVDGNDLVQVLQARQFLVGQGA